MRLKRKKKDGKEKEADMASKKDRGKKKKGWRKKEKVSVEEAWR